MVSRARVAVRTGSGIRYHQYTMTSREPLDPIVIDEMYGLEPVIEPRAGEVAGIAESMTVQCPYCGEAFETPVDLSAGSFQYVEDCQVCCQPIEFVGEVDELGRLAGFTASRSG
jgi:hypothetical protein